MWSSYQSTRPHGSRRKGLTDDIACRSEGPEQPIDAQSRTWVLSCQFRSTIARYLIEGVRDALSGGYPVQPPAEADERGGGPVDVPDQGQRRVAALSGRARWQQVAEAVGQPGQHFGGQ